jgi:hypothetical protein
VEAVSTAFPDVAVWRQSDRRSPAGAHNRALRRAFSGAGDDAVLVLAEDARPEADFLPPLLEVMRWRPRAALVSPKIVLAGTRERIWYAGGRIDWWRGLPLHRGAGDPDDGRFDRPGPTDFATAVAMLVRSQAFDRVGPMDESRFNLLHDVDWSLRARRIGMEVHYQPRSRVRYLAPGARDTRTEATPSSPERVADESDMPAGNAGMPAGDGAELACELGRRSALGSPLLHDPLVRSRLRLIAHHGRWYHWSTAGPRVAAEATQDVLRGWRQRGVPRSGPDPKAAPRR